MYPQDFFNQMALQQQAAGMAGYLGGMNSASNQFITANAINQCVTEPPKPEFNEVLLLCEDV